MCEMRWNLELSPDDTFRGGRGNIPRNGWVAGAASVPRQSGERSPGPASSPLLQGRSARSLAAPGVPGRWARRVDSGAPDSGQRAEHLRGAVLPLQIHKAGPPLPSLPLPCTQTPGSRGQGPEQGPGRGVSLHGRGGGGRPPAAPPQLPLQTPSQRIVPTTAAVCDAARKVKAAKVTANSAGTGHWLPVATGTNDHKLAAEDHRHVSLHRPGGQRPRVQVSQGHGPPAGLRPSRAGGRVPPPPPPTAVTVPLPPFTGTHVVAGKAQIIRNSPLSASHLHRAFAVPGDTPPGTRDQDRDTFRDSIWLQPLPPVEGTHGDRRRRCRGGRPL